MKRYILTALLLLVSWAAAAQFPNPVSWTSEVRPASADDEYEIRFTAAITSPWHMYDMGPYEGGPNPTVFTIEPVTGVQLLGKVTQVTQPKRIEDEIFGMEIGYFADRAVFAQRVKVTSERPVTLPVTVDYMVCDDQSCLPPTDHEFSIALPAAKLKPVDAGGENPADNDDGVTGDEETSEERTATSTSSASSESTGQATFEAEVFFEPMEPATSGSLWSVILEAILWGFAALLTPCVFPMVPMTVSFFLKGSENKSRGRFMALLYGLSIILLYTLPIAVIILVTYFVGGQTVTADIFNWLATHWLPNILFFLVFIVFAISFFGAFEIRLPNKLVNKSDAKADKGGILGVFFMALTLVLVSFSCTGPIVGSVLIKSTQGAIWEPIVTMLAFSVAFALPFTLLAIFPQFLHKLPKSGGWLNSVKVVLGFIEVALAFKFLSVADQTYHWGLLDREVYLAIWIVVFSLLGFYLLGKIRFKHDSELKYIGVPRLALVILVFTFVVYLIPGMWGAPLKALSGYFPPLHTQDFVLGAAGSGTVQTGTSSAPKTVKYGDLLHLPHGLDGFFDYEEGMAYAREVNKPVFLDFTGHGCVNCREMEARVWSAPEVLDLLRNDFVIIALYSDDKTIVPESEWVTTDQGRVLKGLGKINSYFANSRFGINAQPYYLLLDGNGHQLAPPRGYNLDVAAFAAFLRQGIDNYKVLQE